MLLYVLLLRRAGMRKRLQIALAEAVIGAICQRYVRPQFDLDRRRFYSVFSAVVLPILQGLEAVARAYESK